MDKPKHDFLGKKRLEETYDKLEDNSSNKKQANDIINGNFDNKEE